MIQPIFETIFYVNGKRYLSGPTSSTGGTTRIMGSYFGSSTRIGTLDSGEVFSPGSNTPYPECHIRIVEVGNDGIENIVYEGIPDIKSYCISLIESEDKILSLLELSEEEITRFKEDKLKQILEVNAGTYCPLGGFHKMKLDSEQSVSLMFRDLHRWGGCVEISGFSYVS